MSPSTVLIVDDDPIGRAAAVATLTGEGYRVQTADSGPAALAAVAAGRPDVVLLDLMMPGMDGLDVLRHIRADPAVAAVPVLLLTAADDRTVRLAGLAAGADDFLTKPIDRADLRARVRTITRLDRYRRLSHERERYEQLFRLSPDGVLVVGPGGRLAAANPAAARLVGAADPAHLADRPFADLVADDHRPAAAGLLAGAAARAEFDLLAADGRRVPVEASAGPVDGNADRPPVQVVVRDLTARRRADAQLRRQADLLDLASDAVAALTPDGVVTFWNRAAERLYRRPRADAVGRPFADLVDLRPEVEAGDIRPALAARGEWSGVLAARLPDGHELTVLSHWTLTRDPAGRPDAVLVVDTPTGDPKVLEAGLVRAQQAEVVGALAGGVAHDLNNCLTPILVGLDLAAAGPPDAGRQALDTARAYADQAAQLVTQLLALARGADSSRRPTDLAAAAREVTRLVRRTFPRRIEVRVDTPADPAVAVVNPVQVRQVLLNLCVNARDAIPADGAITVAVRPPAGGFVAVAVTDTGVGIPPAHRSHLFEPLFTTKPAGQGTGLGLYTVKRIADAHGGRVEVASEPGRGTTFTVAWPTDPPAG